MNEFFRMLFFGLFGLGLSSALVVSGGILEGGCLGIGAMGSGGVETCRALGENLGAIILALGLLSGFLSVILICATPLLALLHRISPLNESGPSSDGVLEQM